MLKARTGNDFEVEHLENRKRQHEGELLKYVDIERDVLRRGVELVG